MNSKTIVVRNGRVLNVMIGYLTRIMLTFIFKVVYRHTKFINDENTRHSIIV